MLSGKHFYNQTLRKTVAVFGTVFNNIFIKRHNSVSERVPISYGARQKFLARIEQESRTDQAIAIKLPRMAFNITDISYDASIKLNKQNKKVITDSGGGAESYIFQSVPYIVSIELNVLAKTQDEALQIVEQIIPTFTPEYTVTIKDMEGVGQSVDVPITLQDVTLQDDFEGDYETRRTLIYTLNFTMKIRFVGETKSSKIIKIVDTQFHDTSLTPKTINNDPLETVRSEVTVDSPITIIDTFGFDSPS
tara:strand:+ start:26376 stop:27122 length:747 start_codon:yes stop_codon:yes gene_type:complete